MSVRRNSSDGSEPGNLAIDLKASEEEHLPPSDEDDDDSKTTSNMAIRNYICNECGEATSNARRHLWHLVEVHQKQITIYECDLCDYATQYKPKLPRHRKCHFSRNIRRIDGIDVDGVNGGDDAAMFAKYPQAFEEPKSLLRQDSGPKTTIQKSENGSVLISIMKKDNNANDVPMKASNASSHSVIAASLNNRASPLNISDISDGTPKQSTGKNIMPPSSTSTPAPINIKPRPHIREAVDPAKYVKVHDTEGVKYACSKCGNLYKWRKSLNKHWKEKHDGEIPTPVSAQNISILNIPRVNNAPKSIVPANMRHLDASKQEEFLANKFQQQLTPNFNRQFVIGSAGSSFARPQSIVGMSQQGRSQHNRSQSSDGNMRAGLSPQLPQAALPSSAGKATLPFSNYRPQHHSPPEATPPRHARTHAALLAQHKSAFGLASPPIAHSSTFPLQLPLLSPQSPPDMQPLDLSSSSKYQATIPQSPSPDTGILDLSSSGKKRPDEGKPMDFSVKPRDASYGESIANAAIERSYSAYQEMVSPRSPRDIGYHCNKCSFSATSREELSRHMNVHQRRTFSCAECQVTCVSQDELNDHFSNNHMEALQKAAASPKRSQGQNQEHIELYKYLQLAQTQTPPEEKIYNCVVCSSSYKWRWDLARHFKNSHPTLPNPYSRRRPHEEDEESMSEELAEKRYRLNEPSLQCDKCSFLAKTQSELIRHQLNHSLEKTFYCNSCSFNTKSKEEFMLHMRHAHRVNIDGTTAMRYAQNNIRATETIQGDPGSMQDDSLPMVHSPKSTGRSTPSRSANEMSPERNNEQYTSDGVFMVFPEAPEANQTTPKKGEENKLKGGVTGGTSAEMLLPYKCSVCEYRARWPSEITQHMKNHSDEKPFRCPRCSYKSKWKWDVVKHLKRCGGGTVKDVIDTSVDMGFTKKGALNLQGEGSPILSNGPPNVSVLEMVSDDGVRFPGDGREDKDAEMLEPMDFSDSNSSWASGTDKSKASENKAHIQCKQCPFVAVSASDLKRHSRTHSDEKPFMCRTCGYSTKWKCDLKKHLKSNTDHVAAPLPEDFTGEDSKMGESDSDQPKPTLYKCDTCQYVNYKKHLMDSHMKIHEKPSLKNKILGGGGKFKCKQCDFEADDLLTIIQHRQSHSTSKNTDTKPEVGTPTKMEDDKSAQDTSSSGRRRKQAKPGYRQATNDEFQPADKNDLPFQCSKCPFGTSNEAGLQRHLEHHGATNRYICQWCDWSVDSVHTLYQHAKHVHNTQVAKINGKTFLEMICTKSNCSMESVDTEDLAFIMKIDEDSEAEQGGGVEDTDMDMMFNELNPFAPKSRDSPKSLTSLDRFIDTDTPDNVSSPGSPFSNEKARSRRNRKIKTCQKCGYITDNMTNLQRHLDKHGQQAKYVCDYCDYSLDRLGQVQLHMKTIHTKAWFQARGDQVDDNIFAFGLTKPPRGYSRSPSLSDNDTIRSSSADIIDAKDGELANLDRFGGDQKNSPSMIPRKPQTTKPQKQNKQKSVEILHFKDKRRYKCSKCNYVSKNVSSVAGHVKNHGNQRRFTCTLCDYSVDQNHLIESHLTSCHGTINYLLDDDAEVATTPSKESTPSDIDTGRVSINSPSVQHKTKAPRKKSVAKGLFSRRMKRKGRYQCNKCPFTSVKFLRILTHRKLHRTSAKYQCHLCTFQASRAGLLQQHLQYHRLGFVASSVKVVTSPSKKNQSCKKCEYRCSTNVELKKHVRCHGADHKYKCKMCDYSIEHSCIIQNHMTHHHKQTDDSKFKCQLCEEECESAAALEQHIMNHSLDVNGHGNGKSLGISSTNGTPTRYKCRHCPYHSRNAASLQTHTLQHSEKTPRSNVSTQKKTTSDKKFYYRCSSCPYQTNNRGNFENHKNQHGTGGRLRCPYCTYGSGMTSQIYSHIRIHFPGASISTCLLRAIAAKTNPSIEAPKMATVMSEDIETFEKKYLVLQTDEANAHDTHLACAYCNFGTKLTGQLYAHLRRHFKGIEVSNALLLAMLSKANPGTEASHSQAQLEELEFLEKGYFCVLPEDCDGMPESNNNNNTRVKDATDKPKMQFLCQYCDDQFDSRELVMKHEMQHI